MGVEITIEFEEVEGKNVLRIAGRIDAASAPILEKKIDEQVAQNHIRLLLDFSGVDYLSSAGMRLLLAGTKKLKAKEGILLLSGMGDDVMEIIKLAGFERILNIYGTEKEALTYL
jgi:anti-sigma B factor antagonist/stage II sporulation protein AA (anti-sigma F factor antagonist)